jgi:hypothetical protein
MGTRLATLLGLVPLRRLSDRRFRQAGLIQGTGDNLFLPIRLAKTSKPTISRAIKTGRLSAVRRDDGSYRSIRVS